MDHKYHTYEQSTKCVTLCLYNTNDFVIEMTLVQIQYDQIIQLLTIYLIK